MPYLTREQVEQTRMPAEWSPPQRLANPLAGAMLGMGTKGQTGGYAGDPLGMVDPEALRVSAQGGDYDIEGRRNAIAARVAANQAAQAAASSGSGGQGGGSNAWRDYWVQNYGADPNSQYFQGTEDWSQAGGGLI